MKGLRDNNESASAPLLAPAREIDRRATTVGPFAVFFVTLCLTAFVYLPGLNGPFLFDDYPNLERLGSRGPIETLELLRLYLSTGFSGPTGRPLSLLSFLLDANDWPAEAWSFKRTNLVLHLIVGIVLFGTTRRLLLSLGRLRDEAAWIAMFAASLWLLNPFLVSTTLYAVQRMTQLSSLFVLAGVWIYLVGRTQLSHDPRRGYAIISASVPAFTALAILSKENGALLPLLILMMEITLRRHWTSHGPSRVWVGLFLVTPSLLVFGYLASLLPGADRIYAARDFSMYERLLSQARFLWDYLYHLAIPHIQTQGLFQDGRSISTGLVQPWTTLPAVLGICLLISAAFMAMRRWPLVAFALFFFFAGHLLESTIVPLELYFEHRNYLPAAFLFLPVAALAYDSTKTISRRKAVAGTSTLVLSVYALCTWQHAKLWGDEDQLLLVWAQSNPNSVRAQVSASQTWQRNNEPAKALAVLEQARANSPDSPLVVSNLLVVRAELGILTLEDLTNGANEIRHAKFDIQSVRALEQLVRFLSSQEPNPAWATVVNDLLADIRNDLAGTVPPAHKLTLYLQGILAAGQGQPEAALKYLVEALHAYNSVDSGLRMVSDLAGLRQYGAGLELLAHCEELLRATPDTALEVSRGTFERDISRLRNALLEDLQSDSPAAATTSGFEATNERASHHE